LLAKKAFRRVTVLALVRPTPILVLQWMGDLFVDEELASF
jgi:hypothetical protein